MNCRKTTTGIPVSQWVSQPRLFKGLLDSILVLPDKPCHFATKMLAPYSLSDWGAKLPNMFVIIRLLFLMSIIPFEVSTWLISGIPSCSKHIICWCKSCFGRISVSRYFTEPQQKNLRWVDPWKADACKIIFLFKGGGYLRFRPFLLLSPLVPHVHCQPGLQLKVRAFDGNIPRILPQEEVVAENCTSPGEDFLSTRWYVL